MRISQNHAFEVSQLSKAFRLGKQWFWALKEVSFEIKEGEFVGIIGENGSGKSTLLRLLAGLSTPSSGKVHRRGKVSAILDIGHGFHPDLTGYENLFLVAKLQGFAQAKFREKVDEIVSFSGIADFVHQPVKYYSQGMFLRLALSLALHTEAPTLLLDEVLSVGDAAFQWQCRRAFEKMREEGRTLLVVSHQPQVLWQLCDKYMVLRKGQLTAFRSDPTCLVDYARDLWMQKCPSDASDTAVSRGTGRTVRLNQKVADTSWLLEKICLSPESKAMEEDILPTDSVKLDLYVSQLSSAEEDIELVYHIHDFSGQVITSLSTCFHAGVERVSRGARHVYTCRAPHTKFNQGIYFVSLFLLNKAQRRMLFRGQYLLAFEVKKHVSSLVQSTCRGSVQAKTSWRISSQELVRNGV